MAALTAQQLADESGAELARAERILAVAQRMVEDYAPAAPEELRNEAIVRFGGYLLGSDYGAVTEEEIGPRRMNYTVNHAAAFRNSGAEMLLTVYRVRRGGVVG